MKYLNSLPFRKHNIAYSVRLSQGFPRLPFLARSALRFANPAAHSLLLHSYAPLPLVR